MLNYTLIKSGRRVDEFANEIPAAADKIFKMMHDNQLSGQLADDIEKLIPIYRRFSAIFQKLFRVIVV